MKVLRSLYPIPKGKRYGKCFLFRQDLVESNRPDRSCSKDTRGRYYETHFPGNIERLVSGRGKKNFKTILILISSDIGKDLTKVPRAGRLS